jgi:hypothetical protein
MATYNHFRFQIDFNLLDLVLGIDTNLWTMDSWEEKVKIVQKHFESKGYSVHSGLQFGGELVLYADDPEHVHSDFCIHVVRDGEFCFRVSDTSISTVALI